MAYTEILKEVHDSKVWNILFNFDAISFRDDLILLIDYSFDFREESNQYFCKVAPAKLFFLRVSSFKINLSSDEEKDNTIQSDCLYLYNILATQKGNRFHIIINFIEGIGEISFYCDEYKFEIDNENICEKIDTDHLSLNDLNNIMANYNS